jgi:hypothetical protein
LTIADPACRVNSASFSSLAVQSRLVSQRGEGRRPQRSHAFLSYVIQSGVLMRRLPVVCVFFVMMSVVAPAGATEWFVASGAAGTGTSSSPFGRIQDGIAAAQPGDVVTVGSGTYAESLRTVRAGLSGKAILVRAAAARGSVLVTARGRVLTVSHPYFTVEGLVLDGQYGADDAVRVASAASDLTLRDVEVRRSTYDLIDMGAPQRVLIENSLIHHALNAAGGRTDAHGVVAGAVQDLVIRNTEIHTFSGDGVQVDPGRAVPGWTRVTLEGDRIWLAPLPAAENGFAAGTVAGENALDTKASASAARATLVIRDTIARGFRGGLITNMAAFNLKENIDAVVDRVTVSDSEIAFRTRGPGSTAAGARVRVMNAVIENTATAFRYEDNIERLQVWNTTVGAGVTRAFQAASSTATGLDVRNTLFLASSKPAEASDPSNRLATSAMFMNAAAGNYALVAGAAPIDAGLTIAEVTTDRAGVSRPQGTAYDVGAYEQQATATRSAEVVMHARQASVIAGAWRTASDPTAADGLRLWHPDSQTRVKKPVASPQNYFEMQVWADGGVPYRLWLRGKAEQNSIANDSVYAQFSDTLDDANQALFRIGTASAMVVTLAECDSCTLSNWAWQDDGYGIGVLGPAIRFAATGWHTLRVQTREDGISIDQVVLSPASYLTASPGAASGDTTILPVSY